MPDLLSASIARLKAQVPSLRSIEGAASLARLMQSKALPEVTPAAHVVPLGLRGGEASAATGLFVQGFDEAVGVVITLRSYGRTGDQAMPEIGALVLAVRDAIAGWGPEDAVGVFRLVRGQLVSMETGTIVYQLEFAIADQMRIAG